MHDDDDLDIEASTGRRRSRAIRAAWRTSRSDLEAAVKQAREVAAAERRRADVAEAALRVALKVGGWR